MAEPEMWHLELVQLKQYIFVLIMYLKGLLNTFLDCAQPLEFIILFLVLLSK